jgi:hypothetical protein
VEDRGIIEISQVSHVLTFFKLRGVDLSHLCWWKDFFLKKHQVGLRSISDIWLKYLMLTL